MVLFLVLFGQQIVRAQPDVFVSQVTKETIILNEKGILQGVDRVENFITDSGWIEQSYIKKFDIEVNTNLVYEIGEVRTQSESFSVMFVKSKRAAPQIEFLVIYKKENPGDDVTAIDAVRTKWMELCNAHQAGELVKQLYTTDAYYYNRGRLLQGTEAISAEYGYMNSPTYSLKLTPKHVVLVSDTIAFEIGQCSGSYPLPYMLLWEKQKDGNWQVRMDSNY